MKKLNLLFIPFLIVSCFDTDETFETNCQGFIRDYDPQGNLVVEIPIERDCIECGTYIYWECSEPGGCGEYYNASGIFECQ